MAGKVKKHFEKFLIMRCISTVVGIFSSDNNVKEHSGAAVGLAKTQSRVCAGARF